MDSIFNLIITLGEKSLIVLFILSCLILIRHIVLFIKNMMNTEPTKYQITERGLIYLGLSVGIIIMTILTGTSI